jgi:hypothetical protein
MDLKPHLTVSEFFREALCEALRSQGVATSELAEYYLVNLLSEYATSTLDDEPLALRLAQAQTAMPEERARCLRAVGDHSLYVSGFFADSLQRSLVDVDYYIQIGGTAYAQLGHMPARGMPGDVYLELSDKFARFVDVLGEVSEASALGNNLGVVQLYERWLRTGSEWIARRLRARGMVLPSGGESA